MGKQNFTRFGFKVHFKWIFYIAQAPENMTEIQQYGTVNITTQDGQTIYIIYQVLMKNVQ